MMAVAPLMIEHRLIERMIKVMKAEAASIGKTGTVRPEFIDEAVDFIRVYADRCHHGKEEDILFKQLAEKEMSGAYRETMEELVQEHARSRRMTGQLLAAKDRYVRGDTGRACRDTLHYGDARRLLSRAHRERRQALLHPLHGLLQHPRAGHHARGVRGVRQEAHPRKVQVGDRKIRR